ncbi:unnamed protein product [Clavelina lepadiformis]|uniref:Uncharacterized protein n=1 Tax=Clavelina lepadiformis TaxID=159417 RepID=A0ABP0G1X3_CLALP
MSSIYFATPPPKYEPNEDFLSFFNRFDVNCTTIEANPALKKHLLINSFDEDLSWDVRGRDLSLFDLEYDELVRRGTEARQPICSTESNKYRVLNGTRFDADAAKPSLAYTVRKRYCAEKAAETPAPEEQAAESAPAEEAAETPDPKEQAAESASAEQAAETPAPEEQAAESAPADQIVPVPIWDVPVAVGERNADAGKDELVVAKNKASVCRTDNLCSGRALIRVTTSLNTVMSEPLVNETMKRQFNQNRVISVSSPASKQFIWGYSSTTERQTIDKELRTMVVYPSVTFRDGKNARWGVMSRDYFYAPVL